MKKVKYLLIIALAFVVSTTAYAQEKKNFELSDFYERPTLLINSVTGMNPMRDGKTFGTVEAGNFNIYDYKTGDKIKTLFNIKGQVPDGDSVPIRVRDFSLSDDESKVLILTNKKYIYRHSFTADYYVYDIARKTLKKLSDNGSQRLATFSPDGTKVAFMRDNNLFVKDLESDE